ncbi:MAG: cytochrome c biogenesis protein ResB [Candidatus Eisenbacteria bacterium]|nr:cytochrome c biogenesis protein ResB [Candidatus Eisenbacteria bacterium]
MRKGFDDTRVREAGLGRNPLYRTLSSVEFSVVLMLLIGIATLIAALFPQGMDEAFYVARFGERLYRVYDSLGLLAALRSWWFMLLFALLFAALVFCTHSRVREGRPRGTKGTRLYETEFSVPTSTEEVLLIFPVLLSSMGFTKKRIITGEGHWEILAEKGIHPFLSSLLLHLSAVLLLSGVLVTYLFSWGCSVNLELGKSLTVPLRGGGSRWAKFTGAQILEQSHSGEQESLRIELVKLTRHYGPASGALPAVRDSLFSPPGSIPAQELFVQKDGRSFFLKGWTSRLSIARGTRSQTLNISAGESKIAKGLHISQGAVLKTARIVFPALGETLQASLPMNLTFGAAQIAATPSETQPAGRVFRLESPGVPGRRAVRIKVLPSSANEDTAGAPHENSVDLRVGEETQLGGLDMKVIQISEWSLIRLRSDPGWRIVRLGAFLIFLFTMVRLYVYCYVLRAEISGAKGGPSHLSLRIRASGLFASPAGVARKIAGLLAK